MAISIIAKIIIAALPYANNALEPIISEATISYHYGKHYQAYVDNINQQIENTEWAEMSLEELVKKLPQGSMFNNAGQALNHQYYFTQFKPASEPEQLPSESMMKKIEESFGTFDALKKAISHQASTLFGSGWVWLEADNEGTLYINQYNNADNPLRYGRHPIIGIDVWEHAYYLDWQNRRTAHVDSLWKIIDWQAVESRMP